MRSVTPIETPNLFTPDMLAEPDRPVESEDQQLDRVARDFVRWCWSLGDDFHNSPDLTNLRWWLQKSNRIASQSEESEILVEARRLSLKKMEQATRKVDVPKVSD